MSLFVIGVRPLGVTLSGLTPLCFVHAAVRLRVQKLPARIRGAGAAAGRRTARMSVVRRKRSRAAVIDVRGGYRGPASGRGQRFAQAADRQAEGCLHRRGRVSEQTRQGVMYILSEPLILRQAQDER